MADALPLSPAPATRTPEPILQAQGLSLRFGGQQILADVDLALYRGDVVLLTGANGSGKTTLLNVLTGHQRPDSGRLTTVEDGTTRTRCLGRGRWRSLLGGAAFGPESAARAGLGRSWQDSRLFPSQSLQDNVAIAMSSRESGEGLGAALLGLGRARQRLIESDARHLLAKLGLDALASRPADEVSLGQARRAAIARAVAGGARILFLDEPFAGLDSEAIDETLALLRGLVTDHATALVIVEHTLHHARLDGFVTRRWGIDRGLLTCAGAHGAPSQRGFADAADPLPAWLRLLLVPGTRALERSLPRGARLSVLSPPGGTTGAPLLSVRGLVVARGGRPVVGGNHDELDFDLHAGDIGVLRAPNGWGKTTLFEALAGLLPVESGTITLDGRRIEAEPACKRARLGLRAVPSDARLFPDLRTRDVLRLVSARPREASYAGLAQRRCGSLSGGERQALALDAATNGSLGLFDEPGSGLDRAQLAALHERAAWRLTKARLLLIPG